MSHQLRFPVTVRQAQKLVASHRIYNNDIRVALVKHGYLETNYALSSMINSALAKMAAAHGANAILIDAPESAPPATSGEARPKDTAEVAPQSDSPAGGELHGGDGASGEVPDGTSAGGDKGSDTQQQLSESPNSNPPSQNEVGDEPSEPATETGNTSVEAHTSAAGAKGKAGSDEISEAEASMSDKLAPETSDAKVMDSAESGQSDSKPDHLTSGGNAEESAEARPLSSAKDAGDDSETSENYRYKAIRGGGGGQSSRHANQKYGGVTAAMKARGLDRQSVRSARTAFANLLLGGESEEGLRYDWTEFVTRIKTHRTPQPARREEDGRPAILVLADVSGSCANIAPASLDMAQAIGEMGVSGADVVVISHSNGYPHEMTVNGRACANADRNGVGGDEAVLAHYATILHGYNIEVVIAFGDYDAVWLYGWLLDKPSVRKIVWLDDYLCQSIPPTVRQADTELLSRTQRSKLVYMCGVTAGEVPAALAKAVKVLA